MRRAGDRVRIRRQLIDAASGVHLLGRAVRPRAVGHLLVLQDETKSHCSRSGRLLVECIPGERTTIRQAETRASLNEVSLKHATKLKMRVKPTRHRVLWCDRLGPGHSARAGKGRPPAAWRRFAERPRPPKLSHHRARWRRGRGA